MKTGENGFSQQGILPAWHGKGKKTEWKNRNPSKKKKVLTLSYSGENVGINA